MALTKKQMELDKIKWLKSEQMGCDACGSFEFCANCNKEIENPCDNALKLYNKIIKANKELKSKDKKTTTKTTKKSTTKKNTTK